MSFYLFPNSLMFADLLQFRYSDLQAFIHINEFKNIHSDTNYLVKIPHSKFHSPVCKRQNESDTKMFQNNRESGKSPLELKRCYLAIFSKTCLHVN